MSECEQCPDNTYSTEGAGICVDCPDGSLVHQDNSYCGTVCFLFLRVRVGLLLARKNLERTFENLSL